MTHVMLIAEQSEDVDLLERIGDRLQHAFGRKQVTFITAATAFPPEHLTRHPVLLLPIAAQGITAMAWLADESNPAVQTLQAATTMKIPIIPLLMRGASMPRADAFPTSLQSLVNYNAVPLRGTGDFPNDVEQLLRAIKYVEHLHEDEMLTIIPATATQAFTQHLRLPQSRRALALLCGALCLSIMLIELTARLQGLALDSLTTPSPSPLIPFTQIAANGLPTIGVALALVWLIPAIKAPFGRAVAVMTGCPVGVMLLPVGAVILTTLPAINKGDLVLADFGSYNYEFSLLTQDVLPKAVAIIGMLLLGTFIWRAREHWLATGLAGIATIIFPLLGANWAQPAFTDLPIFGAITIIALVALAVATVLMLGRAIRLRRWHWVVALSFVLAIGLGGAFLDTQTLYADFPGNYYYGSDNVPSLMLHVPNSVFFLWLVVIPVFINSVWPMTVLLAPWLMRERVTR